MSLYMEKRVDAVLDKCIQVSLVKRKEALLKINELEELKKIIERRKFIRLRQKIFQYLVKLTLEKKKIILLMLMQRLIALLEFFKLKYF